MARPGKQTFDKMQREKKKREKRKEKLEKRAQKKEEKLNEEGDPGKSELEIATIDQIVSIPTTPEIES